MGVERVGRVGVGGGGGGGGGGVLQTVKSVVLGRAQVQTVNGQPFR